MADRPRHGPGGGGRVLFKKRLKETFFNLQSIAVVVDRVRAADARGGVVGEAARRHGLAAREETEIGWLDALWVGVWQAFALMPGGSRSGTTITGGLFAGCHRNRGGAVLVPAVAAGDPRRPG